MNLNPLAHQLKQFIDSGTQEIADRNLFSDLSANQVVTNTLKAMQLYEKVRRTGEEPEPRERSIDELMASLEK